MGLLDEAIREHLELKRRRGADSGEVARQEQEAFGPARRGDVEPVAAEAHLEEAHHQAALDEPAAAFAEEAPTALHAVQDLPHEHEERHEHLHDQELQDEPPRPQGDPADHLPHAAPAPLPHEHATEHEHEHEIQHEPPRPHGDPADHLPHAVPAPPASASQPTREFDLDEVRAAQGSDPEPAPAAREPDDDEDGEEADVLEETPEFLQETPEHDRLWFEQRPPRDFDF